ncbi:tRNA pseudouridine synthase domain-containing protein [Ditylenchus destructor]|nr:tRNA pseudouridine synthase domain-containing protein [Ditylenchus destructor]
MAAENEKQAGNSAENSTKIESGCVENLDILPKDFDDFHGEDDGVPAKKRKKIVRYAMLIAFQGKNYFGMQIQQCADQPTIESTLLTAFHKYGLITAEESKKPNSFYFQRAARTDRGVSAVRQLCSMHLPFDEDFVREGAEKLNQILPQDIRVLDIRRATRTFHAQKACDARTYSYTIPTYAFAESEELTRDEYRITEKRINEVNEILNAFVGTHNFFNYTAQKNASDASCNRYIMSFKCSDTFIYNDKHRDVDVEFLTIFIKGQSFLLHQIRKMIGMTVSIIRGYKAMNDLEKSFNTERVDIPIAPGNGLLLEKLHYHKYDEKFARTHDKLDDWGVEVEAKVQDIRQRLIIDEMLDNECTNEIMVKWLKPVSLYQETQRANTQVQSNEPLCEDAN